MSANRVVLLLPFFGKRPVYLDYFLASLSGIDMDVLAISDFDFGPACENVRSIRMSFGDFAKLIGQKLGTNVRLDSPKRLCNFKPMLGKVFEDYICDYDYWAFGDCDLVYGLKFNEVLERAIREQVDVLSLRQHWLSGSFCLLRNTPQFVNAYTEVKEWKQMVQSHGLNTAWDECGGEYHKDLANGLTSMVEIAQTHPNFAATIWSMPSIKFIHEDIISEEPLLRGEMIKMRRGRLYRNGIEIPLFHYVCSKIRKYFVYPAVDCRRIGDYEVDSSGFYFTNIQRFTRPVLSIVRKVAAAVRSLRRNGFYRIKSALGARKNGES